MAPGRGKVGPVEEALCGRLGGVVPLEGAAAAAALGITLSDSEAAPAGRRTQAWPMPWAFHEE